MGLNYSLWQSRAWLVTSSWQRLNYISRPPLQLDVTWKSRTEWTHCASSSIYEVPHNLGTSPKAPPPNPVKLEIEFSTHEFCGHIHTKTKLKLDVWDPHSFSLEAVCLHLAGKGERGYRILRGRFLWAGFGSGASLPLLCNCPNSAYMVIISCKGGWEM
jgi:hypothetical protein